MKTNELTFHTFNQQRADLQLFNPCYIFPFEGIVTDGFYRITGEIPVKGHKQKSTRELYSDCTQTTCIL